MGPPHLIQYVSAAHTRICYSSVSPLQEACAIGAFFVFLRPLFYRFPPHKPPFLFFFTPLQLRSQPTQPLDQPHPVSHIHTYSHALHTGFEQAPAQNFWDNSIAEMRHKMALFNAVWDELSIPYSEPEGGYFVMVNLASVQMPANYPFPPHVAERARDFKLAWFLIQELGVAAIPPSEFYTDANCHIAEDYLRFAVCKPDEVLEDAKERLRGLKRFLKQ